MSFTYASLTSRFAILYSTIHSSKLGPHYALSGQLLVFRTTFPGASSGHLKTLIIYPRFYNEMLLKIFFIFCAMTCGWRTFASEHVLCHGGPWIQRHAHDTYDDAQLLLNSFLQQRCRHIPLLADDDDDDTENASPYLSDDNSSLSLHVSILLVRWRPLKITSTKSSKLAGSHLSVTVPSTLEV